MPEIEVITRKWGNSLAVVIPNDIVIQEKIKPNEKIHVLLKKETDLSDLFGKWDTHKTAQQLKDESRKDWE